MGTPSEYAPNEKVETIHGLGVIVGRDPDTGNYLIIFNKKNVTDEFAKTMLGKLKTQMIKPEDIKTPPLSEREGTKSLSA